MSVSDPIADMLTKIRNASSVGHESVDVPSSKMKWEIINILKEEGYIKNFKKMTNGGFDNIRVFLKFDDREAYVIHGIEKI